MKANPGGTIGLNETIGRDQLVRQLWQALEKQSLVLTSERRIGKTTVIRKMKEEAPDFQSGRPLCIMRDLEGLRTPQELIEELYKDLEAHLSSKQRHLTQFLSLLGNLGGAKLGPVEIPKGTQHWKKLLHALIDDICSQVSTIVVFFWDELPLFVHNLKASGGEAAAMEFLDVLREIRQQQSSIRMVFTGSIGLHQVIRGLRDEGYANAPTNDMRTVEVPPLSLADGSNLAELLLDGEDLHCGNSRALYAEQISRAAGHVPYYIHSLIAQLATGRPTITGEVIETYLAEMLADPNDPANFRYYRERIRTYYSKDEEPLALAILDHLCVAGEPEPFSKLSNVLRYRLHDPSDEAAREVIHLLSKDHYLQRTTDGRWSFRYEIVRRWWKVERG